MANDESPEDKIRRLFKDERHCVYNIGKQAFFKKFMSHTRNLRSEISLRNFLLEWQMKCLVQEQKFMTLNW